MESLLNQFALPPHLISAARIPTVALALPVLTGWLTGYSANGVSQGRWFNVRFLCLDSRVHRVDADALTVAREANSIPIAPGISIRLDSALSLNGLGKSHSCSGGGRRTVRSRRSRRQSQL